MKNPKAEVWGKRMDFEGQKNKGLGRWNARKTTNEVIKAIRYKTKKKNWMKMQPMNDKKWFI